MRELQTFASKQNKRFQEHYKLNDREYTLLLMAKLTEELGELSDQVLGYHQLQRHEKLHTYNEKELGKEMYDVLLTLVGIAEKVDINLANLIRAHSDAIQERKLGK